MEFKMAGWTSPDLKYIIWKNGTILFPTGNENIEMWGGTATSAKINFGRAESGHNDYSLFFEDSGAGGGEMIWQANLGTQNVQWYFRNNITTGSFKFTALQDYFQFQDDIFMESGENITLDSGSHLYLGSTSVSIGEGSSGTLDIDGGTNIGFEIGGSTVGIIKEGEWKPQNDNEVTLGKAGQRWSNVVTHDIDIAGVMTVSGATTTSGAITANSGNGKLVTTNAGGAIVANTLTGNPGYMSFGNTADIGISTDGVSAGYDYNGAYIFKQKTSNPTEAAEFIFIEESGDWRFALPKSGAGLGTYNPRSMIIAGPSTNVATALSGASWGFTNLAMDTDGVGADLGVQNDAEILRDVFIGGKVTTSGAANSGSVSAGDIFAAGELAGCRMLLPYGERQNVVAPINSNNLDTAGLVSTTSTEGYRMIRNGSITGGSMNYNCTSFTSGGEANFNILVNGSTAHTISGACTAAGIQGIEGVRGRGKTTFNAGDTIRVEFQNNTSGSFTVTDIIGLVEVVYDS